MLCYFSFSGIVEWLIYHMSVYSCVYCWHDLTVLKWKKNLFGFQTYSCVKNVLFSLVHYKGQSLFEVTFAFSYFIFHLIFYRLTIEKLFCQNIKGYVTSASDSFTNLIHHFFHEFFSVWAVEKDNKLLIVPKQFFSHRLPVEKEIFVKEIRRFGIRDSWNYLMNSSMNCKVEQILIDSLDSILSPSPSVKIQIMGRKVCLV